MFAQGRYIDGAGLKNYTTVALIKELQNRDCESNITYCDNKPYAITLSIGLNDKQSNECLDLKEEYNLEEKIENKTIEVNEKYLEIASILENKIIVGLKKGDILAMKDLDTLNTMIVNIMRF